MGFKYKFWKTMNKKGLFWSMALLVVLGGQLQAQDLQSILKSVASNVADKVTGGTLTEVALVATWNYAQPGVKLGSDNAVADVAASATTASLQTKLADVYEKVGIKSGSCSVTFNADSTFSLVVGSHTIEGTYAFESSTHGITFTVSGDGKFSSLGSMNGFAYLNGTNLQLLFSASKVLSFVQLIGEKASSLSSSLAVVNTLVSAIDDLYIGFEFDK